MDWIKEQSEKLQDELVELRRDFHAHPELGFEEHRTSGKVEEYLQKLGLKTQRVAGTGVVAMIEGKEDSTEAYSTWSKGVRRGRRGCQGPVQGRWRIQWGLSCHSAPNDGWRGYKDPSPNLEREVV